MSNQPCLAFQAKKSLPVKEAFLIRKSKVDHADDLLTQECPGVGEDEQYKEKAEDERVLNGLRVSPHIYMLKSDLDIFVEALRQVVKHS